MSVERLKAETSSSNFVKWQAYYEEKDKRQMNDHDSTVWHLAQVAELLSCVPYRVWGQEIPKSLVGIEKYLLKFTTKEEFLKNKRKTERQRKKLDSQLSFSVFTTFFGIDPVTMMPKGKPTAPQGTDPVNPPESSQNGPSKPVFSSEGVPTPPVAQNKKTGRSSANVSIRGKAQ